MLCCSRVARLGSVILGEGLRRESASVKLPSSLLRQAERANAAAPYRTRVHFGMACNCGDFNGLQEGTWAEWISSVSQRSGFLSLGSVQLSSSTAHDYTVFTPLLPLGLCPFAPPPLASVSRAPT